VFADEPTAERAFGQLTAKDARLCYADSFAHALEGREDLDAGEPETFGCRLPARRPA
jgi:hypothetical protein